MTEIEILDGLHALGIGARNHRLVLLLPLVQVAWADDRIQPGERERILSAAHHAGLLDEEGFALVQGWLTQRPTEEALALGRELLVSLAHRQRGIGAGVEEGDIQQVHALCEGVAAAAGGLFGVAFTISSEEKSVLEGIDTALAESSRAFLEQLPASETGHLEEL